MKEKVERPDTITIEITEDGELFADSVDLFVSIRGKSFFTGHEALKKAKEVRELVEGLTAFGLSEEGILIQSIQADVSTGVIGKQSSAIYRLRIRCQRLDELADILGIITTQKNTDLGQMVWRYSNAEEFHGELLEKCLWKSKQKAERVASALGVGLVGVHEFDEQVFDAEAGVMAQPVAAKGGGAFKARSVSQEALGLLVSHSKRVTLKVTTKYRVSLFGSLMGEE